MSYRKTNTVLKLGGKSHCAKTPSVKIRHYFNQARFVELSCPYRADRLARGAESPDISSQGTPEKEHTARDCKLEIVGGSGDWTVDL
jgi:hypothetical protein